MLSQGLLIGIIVGGCVLVIAAIILAVLFVHRRSDDKKRGEEQEDAQKQRLTAPVECTGAAIKSQFGNLRDVHQGHLLKGLDDVRERLRNARNPSSENYLMELGKLRDQTIEGIEQLVPEQSLDFYADLTRTNCLDEKDKKRAIKAGRQRALDEAGRAFKSYDEFRKREYRAMGPSS